MLLDLNDSEKSNFNVCAAIRKHEAGEEKPVFIVTDRDNDDAIEEAYRAGATDIVFKPISLPVLPHRIRYAMRTARSLSDPRGLIRAIPDLIFVVNEHGEVQDGLSRPDATHTLQIKALTTASLINFYPCENDDGALERTPTAASPNAPS